MDRGRWFASGVWREKMTATSARVFPDPDTHTTSTSVGFVPAFPGHIGPNADPIGLLARSRLVIGSACQPERPLVLTHASVFSSAYLSLKRLE